MLKRYFSFLLPPRQRRRVPRKYCEALCWIEFVEKKYRIEGVMRDISIYGGRSRPLSDFIVNRTGGTVKLHVGDDIFIGTVRNSTPGGYGIEFHDAIDQTVVNRYAED